MAIVALICNITTLRVVRGVGDKRVFAYGPPQQLLSDINNQVVSSFQYKCVILGFCHGLTPEYHPQINWKGERFSRTICTAVCPFCSENGIDWDLCVHDIA